MHAKDTYLNFLRDTAEKGVHYTFNENSWKKFFSGLNNNKKNHLRALKKKKKSPYRYQESFHWFSFSLCFYF